MPGGLLISATETLTPRTTNRSRRVLDDELGAFEVVLVIDLCADQVLVAHRVDQQGDAVLYHRGVIVVHDLVEGEAVLEARATAALHEDAQFQVGIALFLDQLGDLLRGAVGEVDGRRHGVLLLRAMQFSDCGHG
jgi:hypothetical protein